MIVFLKQNNIFIIVLALVFLPVAAQASFKSNGKLALKAMKEKNYQQAQLHLSNLYSSSKQRKAVFRLVGRNYFFMGRYALSALSYQKAKLTQTDFAYYLRALHELGDFQKIISLKKNIQSLGKKQRSDKHYFLGLIYTQKGDYVNARKHFSKVSTSYPYYKNSLYDIAMSYAHQKKNELAIKVFHSLQKRAKSEFSEHYQMAATIGLARVHYQNKNWSSAIRYYRAIPKASNLWKSSMFELAWAYIRDDKYRSAMGILHTLHSPYFQTFYNPESFFLRSFIYEKICLFKESSKVLGLFAKTYKPVLKKMSYYKEYPNKMLSEEANFSSLTDQIIFNFADVRGGIQEIQIRKAILKDQAYLASQPIKRSALGLSLRQLLKTYSKKNIQSGKNRVTVLMESGVSEMQQLFRNHQDLAYELLFRGKDNLKSLLASDKAESISVERSLKRSYYIKNGYEFWPFRGEYWLDELGAYTYVGQKNCQH